MMTETIWTVRDVAKRYKCSPQCARNYMRKMAHMEEPLTVYESDLLAWEQSRMTIPAGTIRVSRDKPLTVPRKREG